MSDDNASYRFNNLPQTKYIEVLRERDELRAVQAEMRAALQAVLAYHDSKFPANRELAIEMVRAAYAKGGAS